MAGPRSSNLNRSEWNKKCRERLSQHINDKLGIIIEPSQVRLKPNPDDVYNWERMGSKEHLFSKNISDHSIRALKELYREVGQSFEAVENGKSHTLQTGVALRERQNKAELETKMRQQAEIRVGELERTTQTVREDNERLERHVQDWKLIAEQCESRKIELDKVIRKIFNCLEGVAPELDR